jgi:hypothetical protein
MFITLVPRKVLVVVAGVRRGLGAEVTDVETFVRIRTFPQVRFGLVVTIKKLQSLVTD